MTRKKKTKVSAKSTKPASKGNGSKDPSAKNPLGLTGPIIDDETGVKSFSKADLSMYELAQYKLANMTQSVRLKQIDIDNYRREAEKHLTQLQSQKEHLRIEAKKQGDALVTMQNAITKQYGVDLSKISYDDETGKINLPDEPATTAAGQPAA